jgi:hypothetical protein
MGLLIELVIYGLLVFLLPFPLNIVVTLVGLASVRLFVSRAT